MSLKIRVNAVEETVERNLVAMIGAKLYTLESDFTQDKLYSYGGCNDAIFTLTFKKGSASFQIYGEIITVCLIYSLKERKALADDSCSLNEKTKVNAELLNSKDGILKEKLKKEGFNIRDIESMIVLPYVKENNTHLSDKKREPNVIGITFETSKNGKDFLGMYEYLKRLQKNGVGLMPEDVAKYLGYKLVFEFNQLTNEEKNYIFDDKGRIADNKVAYYFLLAKEETSGLNEEQKLQLSKIKKNRTTERIILLDKALKDIGLNINIFLNNYHTQAVFLMGKIINFSDISFNSVGKYPLYMDFNTFLHVYFRHTDELNISRQFTNRDKFQLEEKDIFTVINIVMSALNNDFQKEKEGKPYDRFYRAGEMAYYYNGDYYNVYVDSDGRISTFYRGTGKGK